MAFYIMRQNGMIEGSPKLDGLPDGMDPLDWIQGEKRSAPKADLVLNLSIASGDYRGDIIDGFLTLYSDELKEALDNLGVENIDYYPVGIRDQQNNQIEDGYSIANIIGLLNCVDMDKSKAKPWPSGRGHDFDSIVIDPEKTNALKIFRLKIDPSKVIINEELKRYFEETDSLYGAELIRTEDYSDW